jgi:hypothetical protein
VAGGVPAATAPLPPGVTRYVPGGAAGGVGADGMTNEGRRAGLLPPPLKLGSMTARGSSNTTSLLNGTLANGGSQQQAHGHGAAGQPHLPTLGSARIGGDPLGGGGGGPGKAGGGGHGLNGGSLRRGA